ncbi:baseplate J/gp47 family protein, partial [Patescibacteria group bacterium]|nr:baseplate J/gp47 family protein [Patescibacteria group bacterium]
SVKQQATMVDTAAPLHTPSSIHRLMARWRVLVLVVFAGLALLLVFLWQRGVFLKIMGRNPSEPVLATSERVITFPVVVSLTATSSVPNALIGSVYDAEEAGEQPVPLSDRYVGKSTGTIRIQNTAVQARVLPAGLLLRTASGTQFVVRDAVTVPARSTSAALFVQAEAEGEQGDIAPQSLSIVDTAAVPQTGLHLSNSTAFSGGAARGTVSLAAITQAKQELTEAVFTKAVRVWEQKKDHLRFFPQDVLERTVVSSSSLALGIMLERDALVRVRVRIRTVSLSEEQLLAAARSVAPAQLDGADAAERYVFSGWELGVGSVDQQNGTATIVVTARATPSS